MNIYVESNFVLEFALRQAQFQSCENIITLCESGRACLVLPAFCLAEPFDTLVRRTKDRKELKKKLDIEFNQLSRTALYTNQLDSLREVSQILIQSSLEEEQRLHQALLKILKVCEVIQIVPSILTLAADYRLAPFELDIQDAIVYASIVHHLSISKLASRKCFINRNSRDFNKPDIQAILDSHACKMLFNFDKGYNYILSVQEKMT